MTDVLAESNIPKDEQQTERSRLVINKLCLINFKSFAGTQVIGPFHKSFSSIVGPNGSGKSNTIDALLFVFGYRASKMRQSKLSELIHNSAEHPNFDHCAVEVHFRDIIDTPHSEEFQIVEGSDLVVTRMAMRNNQSKYLINGQSSNYAEVTNLLRGRGIDLDHNRFLILQGEVESIAQMKSKAPSPHEDGLLEYLEDIIGTVKYKAPIEESLVDMDKLSDERSERLGRLRIVEKEKDRLEGHKDEAEAYLKDCNNVARKKNILYQRYLLDLSENIEVCHQHIAELGQQLTDEEGKVSGRKDALSTFEAEYKRIEKEAKGMENEMKRVSKSHEDKNKENVKLDVKIKDLNSKIKKLKKTLTDDTHAFKTAQYNVTELTEEMEKARKEAEEHEAGLGTEEEKLESIIDSLKGKTQVFTDQIEHKQKELQPWQAKLSDLQTKIDVAASERDLLASKAESAQNAALEADDQLAAIKDEVERKQSAATDIQDERQRVASGMDELDDQIKSLRNDEGTARRALSQARQKADEAKSSLTANRSQDAVLASLTRLRETGRVSGFHGRLGNLGAIDDKFDIAITTACGALNNFVVDTVQGAQTCIAHLRENNVGRATFIVLEQLAGKNPTKVATPENAPRLIDLVKPKKKEYIPAFYKALGNTLVAKDLSQGNRIAYGKQRWRVVTLQGNVIEASGAMSGGGQRVLKGGMSSSLNASDSVTIETVNKLEGEREKADEHLKEILEKISNLENTYRELRKLAPDLEIQAEKAELDQATFANRISEAEKHAKKAKEASKPDASDAKRTKTLENEITKLEKEVTKLTSTTSSIEREIEQLQEKILEVGGVKLRAQKSKVDSVKMMMGLCNERMTKAEVALSKSDKDINRYEKTNKDNEKKLEKLERELEQINEKNSEQLSKANGVKGEVDKMRDALEAKQDELQTIKAQLDDEALAMQSFNALEADLRNQLEETQNMLTDSESKLGIYNERLSKLSLQDVEEEEQDNEDGEKMEQDAPALEKYTPEDLQEIQLDILKKEISRAEDKVEKSTVNLDVLAEYKSRKQEFKSRAADVQEVTRRRDEAKATYDELRKKRLEEFIHGFSIISSKLKEMYQMITLGGNAELELVDSLDPFSEGIIFSVMPPKKSWKNISNLSGGEKTLSSLALVFALHAYKPTPLYFMDEIDAALDFRNVSIVANYIKDRTKDAQFIIISLRNDMFELSNRLVGIYKTLNATKSLTIANSNL
ncbi:RecF/RecN/SMC protein [Wallemia mellicola]|nr:RecF/RecN/SMC protein [Wallemia mellicola]